MGEGLKSSEYRKAELLLEMQAKIDGEMLGGSKNYWCSCFRTRVTHVSSLLIHIEIKTKVKPLELLARTRALDGANAEIFAQYGDEVPPVEVQENHLADLVDLYYDVEQAKIAAGI